MNEGWKYDIPGKYHDFECCEWTRGIDTLLSRYKQDREIITSLIIHNPDILVKTLWKQDGPLAIDNGCQCQMGNGNIRSPFSCAQCKNMRRLIDFRFGGINRSFQIECGNETGKKLIVYSTEVSNPFISWDNDSARRANFYLQQYQNLTICGTPDISEMKCITGDSFTIRTLIMWMIDKYFSEKGLPHCMTLYTAFICSGIGYSLYNTPSIGTMTELHKIPSYHDTGQEYLSSVINIDGNIGSSIYIKKDPRSQHFDYMPLKSSIVRTIIIQLLVTLLELSKINFSHGTPSINALVFTKDAISYLYDGFHVEGSITLKISDLWNSSATFNNVHYFPKNTKSSMYIEKNMFVPEIMTKTVSMAYCYGQKEIPNTCSNNNLAIGTTCDNECGPKNIALYRLTNSTIDIYNAMRHIGFPLFISSFDFYCFMISLMCDKGFFDTIIKDHKLYRIWSMMWLIEDLHNVEGLIKDAHKIESINQSSSDITINIIRGKWLRCDIAQFLWGLVKLGW